jgi:hypothetical protein
VLTRRLLVLLVAMVSLGVLADGAVIVNHLQTAGHTQAPAQATAKSGPKAVGHPCNHGFYVSRAAHAKKGGAYVRQVAKSDLGKNGICSAPLPAPSSANSKQGADDTDS